jgi:YVTN family beta-propeller protein
VNGSHVDTPLGASVADRRMGAFVPHARCVSIAALSVIASCMHAASGVDATSRPGDRFPLVLVRDVALPGNATRFDYQDIDVERAHLVIAHLGDGAVDIVRLDDGSIAQRTTGIPVARGISVAGDANRIFVTSSPSQLVIIDATTLTEIRRVTTGQRPDGVAWDPVHRIVGVSDQSDGAVSLIADAGDGARTQVPLGTETGNVVFDAGRAVFWAAVVASPLDQLVAIDPANAQVARRIDLPGCSGAHGVRLHPDGQSAFVACENNDVLARVDLNSHAVVTAPTGGAPDVLSVDPGLALIYVAGESGVLTVFDIARTGLVEIDREQLAPSAHSVQVDPATHRVFFPIASGPSGTPVLRIMKPART